MHESILSRSDESQARHRPPQYSLAAIFVVTTVVAAIFGVYLREPEFAAVMLFIAAVFAAVIAWTVVFPKPSYEAQYSSLVRANQEISSGQFVEALESLQEAERFGHRELRAAALNTRGCAYALKGEYGPALADFNKALRCRPEHTLSVYLNRGEIYFRAGRYRQAVADCSRAIECGANTREVYFYRGCAHYELGAFSKAFADLQQATRLDPNYAAAFANLSAVAAAMGDARQAEQSRQRAMELDPSIREKIPPALWDG